jgi:crotonobetainyl-CoA:carnitine CoA-transferase CaiB-like acyl-CoA transferase
LSRARPERCRRSATATGRRSLNLVADFGGGSMFVLLGIVAALFERKR